jgi:membrane protein YqaA with SNARE-associated domain
VIRHVVVALLSAVFGIFSGWFLGEAVGERLHADCIEMDCLAINLYALGGAVLFSIALSVVGVVLSWKASRSRT